MLLFFLVKDWSICNVVFAEKLDFLVRKDLLVFCDPELDRVLGTYKMIPDQQGFT